MQYAGTPQSPAHARLICGAMAYEYSVSLVNHHSSCTIKNWGEKENRVRNRFYSRVRHRVPNHVGATSIMLDDMIENFFIREI